MLQQQQFKSSKKSIIKTRSNTKAKSESSSVEEFEEEDETMPSPSEGLPEEEPYVAQCVIEVEGPPAPREDFLHQLLLEFLRQDPQIQAKNNLDLGPPKGGYRTAPVILVSNTNLGVTHNPLVASCL
jgi:hypothetical protein